MGSTETLNAARDTSTAAIDLAGLVQQLIDAGERRVREDVARRIVATLGQGKPANLPDEPPTPTRPPLEEVAAREQNGMYDVLALLRAVEERVDALAVRQTRDPDYDHDTLRLVQLARERVEAAVDAFDPYI